MGPRLILIRHGLTAWNQTGRAQGRADVPLSDEGRARLAGARLAPDLWPDQWWSSPLARARQTAALIGARDVRLDDRLIEMDFGRWEGKTYAEVKAETGPGLAANEAWGLDMQPPGGESPRQVRARLASWLAEITGRAGGHAAVTHKGVIRAALSLALDWDMTTAPPVTLDWTAGHGFDLDATGRPTLVRPNIVLLGP